jgi:aldose 1-epimerase
MSAGASITSTEKEGYHGYELAVAGGEWAATLLPSVGMVGCSLRYRGVELLAQRGGVSAYARRGSTFGIPLLHPWANRLSGWTYEVSAQRVELDPDSSRVRRDGDTGLPIHGLLAASPLWTVRHSGATSGGAHLRAELDFGADQELLDAFPFPHRLDLEARLDRDGFALALTLTPTSELAVPLCFGFHPYLQLPADGRDAATITLPVLRRLTLDGRGLPSGGHEHLLPGALDGPLAGREFDACYDELSGDPPRFVLDTGRLQTTISFLAGFTCAQVFAPPEQDFICFEPMVAPVNALVSGQGLRVAPPHSTFRAAFSISSRER